MFWLTNDFKPLLDSYDKFDRFVDKLLDSNTWKLDTTFNSSNYVSYTSDDGKSKVYEFAVPGFTKDEINLTFKHSILTIDAENTNKHRSNSYHFSITLPDTNDETEFTTNLENGILSISYPIKTKALPKSDARRIELK